MYISGILYTVVPLCQPNQSPSCLLSTGSFQQHHSVPVWWWVCVVILILVDLSLSASEGESHVLVATCSTQHFRGRPGCLLQVSNSCRYMRLLYTRLMSECDIASTGTGPWMIWLRVDGCRLSSVGLSCVVYSSLRDITIAPPWQDHCANINFLTYLLTYKVNFADVCM